MARHSRKNLKWKSAGFGLLACLCLAFVVAVGSGALSKPAPAAPGAAQEFYDSTSERAAQAAAEDLAKRQAAYDDVSVEVPIPGDGTVDYLLVGDSLANGAAATSAPSSFRELIRAQLSSRGAMKSVLAGKAGQGVDLIAPQALAAGDGFDVIVVEVGTNDVKTSAPTHEEVEAFTISYREFLAALRAKSPGAALICLGPWRDAKVAAEYESTIEVACNEQSGKYRALSEHYKTAENRWRDGVMPDGTPVDNFHPSDEGHADIASEVLSALRLDGARPGA